MNKPLPAQNSLIQAESLIPTRWSLIERLKNWDDEKSWRSFFETYWRLIYGVALKSGLTHSEAEDVVQDTVVCVCKSMASFRANPQRGHFKAWLLQLTRWRIVDQVRKRSPAANQGKASWPTIADQEDVQFGEPQGILPGGDLEKIWNEEWEDHVIKAALEKVKQQVSSRKFQVFYMHVIKEIPAAETARLLRVSTPLVYLTKHRVKPLFERAVRDIAANE